jgi:hypothetical protein
MRCRVWGSCLDGPGERMLARVPSGFKEGSRCSGLAAALEGEAARVWDAAEPAGMQGAASGGTEEALEAKHAVTGWASLGGLGSQAGGVMGCRVCTEGGLPVVMSQ